MFSSLATVKSQARWSFERRISAARRVLKIDSKRRRWPLIAGSAEGRSSR